MYRSDLSENCRTTPLPEGYDQHVQSFVDFIMSPTFSEDWDAESKRAHDPPEVRVARGVARLDERSFPDWRERIDTEHLNLRTPWCILGQLYGSYIDGHIALDLGPLASLHGRSYGFFEFSDKEAAEECERHWRKVIRQTR
jgi:hypothetical protein